ncbi:uncharacterized protein B0I36DRAFT_334504 [Microdochium trichocladiopsis]|uniref:Zn(2)-C6 fungal-type domain-containing protein n=1 Tax=Microdochium trichocladiopsis TaxID=1682393 RepID=A0A9P8XWJ9_9PEZI|nr:uncharacterized protein B0I36DRAFT_334504 [Microdochium trichocladiopsis]KAH7021469.1 hypothetical protein B0I36DRAFT_334504 [Microdochium trichocladiopsis]
MHETETPSLEPSPSSEPSPAVWRRACTACTGAKRKCSKQVPRCRRCDHRGLECFYPPARASAGEPHLEMPLPSAADVPLQPADISAQEQPPHPQVPDWFLAPDSWEVAHLPPQPLPDLFGEETLSAYVTIIQSWLRMWVTDDHCPFIHRYLYRAHMPRRMQDAYTTISAYLHKTPETEATVRRIIEHRLQQLMEENFVESSLELGSTILVDHLARVQALLVLLVICLFDGSIRLRAQAELHLATLSAWNDQMWQVSTQEVRSNATLEPWRLWIFGESIRRTWLTTSIIHCVYITITQGYSWCPGGVYCTFGNELWDARTAHDWERKSESGRKRLFMQSLDVMELFLEDDPDAVDAFGHAIMLITSGIDKVQRWTARKDASPLT